MTVDVKIQEAIKKTGIKKIWPFERPLNEDPEEWCVYNPDDETPDDFGDDTPGEWMRSMQIHLFYKKNVNVNRIKKSARIELQKEGFTISRIIVRREGNRDPSIRNDGKATHLIIYCNIEEDWEEWRE